MDDDSLEQDTNLSYHFSQLFGYRGRSQKLIDQDVITAIRFDPSGHYLAVGDRAGRVIMFSNGGSHDSQYQYFFEFQSHERQLDRLKNVSLPQQIKEVRWMAPQEKYKKLVTSNSYSIKMWKLYQKREKKLVKSCGKQLSMPKLQQVDPQVVIDLKKVFPNKHQTPINSFSIARNEQFMLTTDATHGFLWNLQESNRPFIVKQNQEKQKITCSVLHPDRDDLFISGCSSGNVNLTDLRSGLFDTKSNLTFQSSAKRQEGNFVQQAISKCSAVLFLNDRRQIAARDLICVRIWDLRSSGQPLDTISIDQKIRSKLSDLFQAECLDDKFSLTQCPATGNLLTGNYSNSFHLLQPKQSQNVQYELDYNKQTRMRSVGSGVELSTWSCADKVLVHDVNPQSGQIAAGSLNCFFIYNKGPPKQEIQEQKAEMQFSWEQT